MPCVLHFRSTHKSFRDKDGKFFRMRLSGVSQLAMTNDDVPQVGRRSLRNDMAKKPKSQEKASQKRLKHRHITVYTAYRSSASMQVRPYHL